MSFVKMYLLSTNGGSMVTAGGLHLLAPQEDENPGIGQE